MNTINTYSASELKEQFPDGFERAHKKYCDTVSQNPLDWQSEIIDSLKAMYKPAGIGLRDWSISDSSPSWVEFSDFDLGNIWGNGGLIQKADYTGKKALAWVKDAYELKTVKRVNYTYKNEQGKKVKSFRYEVTKKDGIDWDCEFTGVCYDHDFLDSLLDDINSGCTLSESYHNLADKAGKIFYDEYQSQLEENYFIDHADANEYQFTEEGVKI